MSGKRVYQDLAQLDFDLGRRLHQLQKSEPRRERIRGHLHAGRPAREDRA